MNERKDKAVSSLAADYASCMQSVWGWWIFFWIVHVAAHAQVMHEKVFRREIRSVRFHPVGKPLGYPVYRLDEGKKLVLSFDDLSAEYREFHCQILHCDRQWRPSKLYPLDYRSGLESEIIRNVSYSEGTFQQYAHYEYEFPSDQMRPTRPGNYVLIVFENGNLSDTVIVRRFYVVKEQVKVTGQVRVPALPRYAHTHHDFFITVDISGMNRPVQPHEFTVVLRQNKSWMWGQDHLLPTQVAGDVLTFDYAYESSYYLPGHNEWRAFDGRSVRSARFGVRKITFQNRAYHMTLYPDEPRATSDYSFFKDNNGDYYILTDRHQTPEFTADYVYVHFRLKELVPTQGVPYVYGALTDWRILPEARMEYRNGRWETTLYLKQGYYDYMYVLQQPDGSISFDAIEGSFYETENDYLILVYYRNPQLDIDEIVGWVVIKSAQ